MEDAVDVSKPDNAVDVYDGPSALVMRNLEANVDPSGRMYVFWLADALPVRGHLENVCCVGELSWTYELLTGDGQRLRGYYEAASEEGPRDLVALAQFPLGHGWLERPVE